MSTRGAAGLPRFLARPPHPGPGARLPCAAVKTNLASAPPRPTEATSFRLRLQAELARRCAGNPRYSLRAFARRLGVDHSTLSQLLRGRRALTRTVDEVNLALQRLVRLGLLEMRGERWVDRSGDTRASLLEFGERAVQRLFAQVSALVEAALREVPSGLRERSTTTLAVPSARVPEALERIARFRRELGAFLEEEGGERDDVYQIGAREGAGGERGDPTAEAPRGGRDGGDPGPGGDPGRAHPPREAAVIAASIAPTAASPRPIPQARGR